MKKIIVLMGLFLLCFIVYAEDDNTDVSSSVSSPAVFEVPQQTTTYLAKEIASVTETDSPRYAQPIMLGAVMLRMFGALTVIIFLIWFFVWILRRVTPLGRQINIDIMRLVASLSIMPGKTLHVIEIAGEYLVFSSDNNAVRYCVTLDATASERVRDRQQETAPLAAPFKKQIRSVIRSFDERSAQSEDEIHDSIQDIHAQIEKLKNLKNKL